MKAEILSLARNCEPHVAIPKISQIGKAVVIEILEGEEKPYGCSSGYFRRLDAVTQKMTQKEIGVVFKRANTVSFEEKICPKISWHEISKEKIQTFLKEADITADANHSQDLLTNLKLANKDGIKNAGVLFFARDPREYILHCETILVSFKGTSRVDIIDRKDVQDDLWTQYQEAMIFLKRHLSIRTEIKGLDRKDSYEIPLEALREAVANALIHRDYNIRGTSIMIEVHEDRVIIKNPGGFPEGMTTDKLGKLSVRRNELIADIFARMHRVERMGSGFKRIREFMNAEGLPFPKIASDSFFFIEFTRPKKAGTGKKQGSVKSSVKSSVKIIELVRQDKNITIPAIAETLGLTTRAVEKQLANLQKMGHIRRIGPDNGGHWEVVRG